MDQVLPESCPVEAFEAIREDGWATRVHPHQVDGRDTPMTFVLTYMAAY